MRHRIFLATLVFLLLTGVALPEMPAVAPVRDRIEPVNRMLVDRLDNLLPTLMREVGIDMWLVINREYVEDPVYLTLVPEPAFNARRSPSATLGGSASTSASTGPSETACPPGNTRS